MAIQGNPNHGCYSSTSTIASMCLYAWSLQVFASSVAFEQLGKQLPAAESRLASNSAAAQGRCIPNHRLEFLLKNSRRQLRHQYRGCRTFDLYWAHDSAPCFAAGACIEALCNPGAARGPARKEECSLKPRKAMQAMYAGKLHTCQLWFCGPAQSSKFSSGRAGVRQSLRRLRQVDGLILMPCDPALCRLAEKTYGSSSCSRCGACSEAQSETT